MYKAQKKYQEKYPGRVAASAWAWRERNKEKIKRNNKLYQEKNREKILAYKREYRRNNPEKIKRGKRKWFINKINSDPKYAAKYFLRLEELRQKYGKSPKYRYPIPPQLRFEVFKRDNFTCQYCGAKAPNVAITIDHIIPVTKGGKTTSSNMTTACGFCNIGKSNKI